MSDIREYPQMLYHTDGRKKVAKDEQHHAELAKEGYVALDADNQMPGEKPKRGRPPKVKDGDDNALRS